MKEEVKINNIKTPQYKILLALVIIGLIVILLELFSKNISLKFSLYNIYDLFFRENLLILGYSINLFLVYLTFFIVIILIIFFIAKFIKERNETGLNNLNKKITDNDIRRVLKITDKLLGKLPKKEIDKFSKDYDSKVYKKVLKSYGVK